MSNLKCSLTSLLCVEYIGSSDTSLSEIYSVIINPGSIEIICCPLKIYPLNDSTVTQEAI